MNSNLHTYKKKTESGMVECILETDTLQLKLIQHGQGNRIEFSSITLTEDTLPEDLKLIPLNLKSLFVVIQRQQCYLVDWEESVFIFQYVTKVGSLEVERKVEVYLEKQMLCEKEITNLQKERLKEENYELKKEKDSFNKRIAQLQKKINLLQLSLSKIKRFKLLIVLFILFILFILFFPFIVHTQNNPKYSLEQQNLYFLKSPFQNLFSFQANLLTYLGNYDYKYVQIMRNKVIPYNKPFQFKIKLKNIEQDKLIIGIVDYQAQIMERTSYLSSNAVAYSSMFGTIYHGKGSKETGNTVSNGLTITVNVQLNVGKISWQCEKQKIGEIELQWIKNREKKFVPYLQFLNGLDQIEWIESED